ncbi:PREDICTED: TM2 domain-containing protein 1-like [Amphimedon queenslandica]|uniref:TM2 domain-containing protein n=1 Tax=Amphimedon queenslandica TaxID=400682 RepID=A0A1X7TZH1_AMPQE|nr:PREDICTED: TM2 domain-containing protein 1-like [Amphimedon queenslandica]|eukprot:XP_011406426.1 PREDICTED: TM2 domain-containing protein 1-like [Amphimedon queenslandica]
MASAKSTFLLCLLLFLLLVSTATATYCTSLPETQEVCSRSLLPGQYYCSPPSIDTDTQSVSGCRPNGTVLLPCYAAPNVTCTGANVSSVNDFDEVVFCKEETCRYVNGRRYNYFVAVGLSLFLGMFGIDRFYLGYPAIGLLKLCTVGFFFIGQLVDFLLIAVQAVGPADQSEYYGAFYGPLLMQANTTDPYLEISDSPCV